MSNWKRYENGNYTVHIDLETGTKIRENDLDNLTPAFAENMDVKITNYCNLGCVMCHEDSTIHGKHGNILNEKFINSLHPYQELAIGGGNPLDHPDLLQFLKKLKDRKIIANLTVNQVHFEENQAIIEHLIEQKLIYGIGVSLTNPSTDFINLIKKYKNAVIHTINGITTVEQYKALATYDLKVLILGYKDLRRGMEFYDEYYEDITKTQVELYDALETIINEEWFKVVSFDNLAIEQLEVKRLLTDREWEQFYMGDDSIFTFYVDLVEEKFAKSSTAPLNERYDLLDSVDEMFERIRKK